MKKIHFKAFTQKFLEKVTNEKGEIVEKIVYRSVRYNPYYFIKK